MGAFAAILFSGKLNADKIISISPQFSIRDDFDTRWKKEAIAVQWSQEISTECLSKNADYYMIYDNYFHLDRLQVEKIGSVIDPSSFHEIRVPFSGHPSGHLMLAMKCLSSTILDIVNQENFPSATIDIPVRFLINNHKSLLNIARQSKEIGRTELSHIAYRKLMKVFPGNEKMMGEYSAFLEQQGMLKMSLGYMNRMISLNPSNPYFFSKAADLNMKMRKYHEAMKYCEKAIAIDPENGKFASQKNDIMKRM
jgi:tetratricopeptide (TPR) repeat protein